LLFCGVIIIACAEITAKHIMGLQPWADFIGNPATNIQENSHELYKYYPFGPACVVDEKKKDLLLQVAKQVP
jgi:hypothetical protein